MRTVLGTSTSLFAFVFLLTVTSVNLRADNNAPTVGQPVDDGEAGILLLEDGGVLAGQITRAADWYIVTRGGGQIQIARKRVTLVCRTLTEAYEFRRTQMGGEKAADHLRLAEWCIRNELRAEAGRELVEARRIDPDQPRLAVLERRLQKTSGPAPAKESVYLAAAKAGAKPPLDKLGTDRQVTGVARPAASHATELPAGAVEQFTRKVQPVLVNNCSAVGCHQVGGKQSFQLDRALLRGEANRRSTMHNLEAALALVDRAHPNQSPLLTVPRKKHGGAAGPIFGPRQEQAFKHLVDWVALVVPPPDSPVAAADATSGSVDANAASASAEDRPTADTRTQDAFRLPSHRRSAIRAASASDDDAAMTLRTPHRLQVGTQLKSWQPRDAFDPEIFNRGQRSRASAEIPAVQTSFAAAAATVEKR